MGDDVRDRVYGRRIAVSHVCALQNQVRMASRSDHYYRIHFIDLRSFACFSRIALTPSSLRAAGEWEYGD